MIDWESDLNVIDQLIGRVEQNWRNDIMQKKF